ncbi:hypothetical protein L596_025455 [Steinernema carpocapsae]|uniref:Uncharacterized protein n=1 Tax=Steinernema carpocapsae TaxID=34508 RepID=A0A4U5M7T4_STECR|nr:hypothetical protein L596_025455 [Steinernema carpocapsae]
MLQIATDDRFNAYKLNKIGFHKSRLYVAPKRGDRLEIWNVDCAAKGEREWTQIVGVNFDELLLAYHALDDVNEFIYVLTVGVHENGNEVPCIALFQIAIPSGVYEVFRLDPDSGPEFEDNVFLDNVVLGSSKGILFLYDKTVVMGTIPFWQVMLNEISLEFGLKGHFVEDIESEPRCTRFPLVLDGSRKLIVKITAENSVFVFDQSVDKWIQCDWSDDSDLFLAELRNSRGLSETFGRLGHRIGAVESPLSFSVDGNLCVAKVLDCGVHVFYRFIVDIMTRTYRFVFMKSIKLDSNLNKRFYMLCSLPKMIFINPQQVAVYDIDPASLEQLAFLRIQRQYRINPETNELREKLSLDEIKQIMCEANKKTIKSE